MTSDNTATRRRVLRSLGVVGLAGLAGCSGDGDEGGTETPAETPTERSTETPAETSTETLTETPGENTGVPTTATTDTRTETSTETSTPPPTPKETVRAAWLYNAEVGERGWAWAHNQARQTVEAELDWLETDFTANVAPGDAEQALRDYVDEGYDVIFGTTADYADALGSVASDNPDTAFEHCQGFSTDINKGRYFGRMDQLRYLTGVAAGMVTEANALGYVAPYPFSEIVRGINAFTLGARSVNEDATVSVEWSKAWFEPSAESDAADVLLQDGVDVMAQHQDSTAALETAADDGVWATGYQSPMGEVAGENYLTSPLWNWAAFYEPTLRDVRNVEWTADFYYGGLGDGVVTLDDWGPMVSGDVKNEVASTRDDIASGNLDIWADSAFSDWSEGERYEQMGAGGNGSYVDGVEGSLSEEDLPGE